MRKSPWFYLGLFGLSVFVAVFTRLTMAVRQEDFHIFPDAPFWIFLEVLLGIYLIDRLNARWLARGRRPAGSGYYLRLMGAAGVLFVGVVEGLSLLLSGSGIWRPFVWEWYPWVRELGSTVFLYLIFSSVYLPFLYQQHVAAAQTALERSEKEAARAHLLALQQHVDPHFLFNNLNILTALIEPDNAAAQAYVAHLANLYRYLVRTRQQEAVPVAEELAFARDYQYLLRQRFGAAYQFEEDLRATPAELRGRLLPPGVLQELLANAVKHNLASRARPLRVRLTVTPTALVLHNGRQPRPAPAAGEQSGLAGLRARFALLTDVPVQVASTAEFFAVTLPLIPALALPDYAARTDSGR